MRRRPNLFFALPLMLVAACLAGRATAEQLTVMSYNVENMFDVFDDPYTDDERTDAKPNEQIIAIAKAIASVDADVVVFQELENEHLLQGMVDTFLPEGGYRYVACQRTNSTRGINLGVISRYPIKRLTSHRFLTLTHPDVDRAEQTWRFARDAMQVTLDIKGSEVHVFNVHLKSNSTRSNDPHSMKWRTAEAAALKGLFRDLVVKDPGALVLAMGDFNSNIETRAEQPRPWPATALIREPEADGSQLMNDAHAFNKAYDDRVTILGDEKYPPAVFDFIYASPALHNQLVRKGTGVIRDKLITAGSDHLPVYATYEISD